MLIYFIKINVCYMRGYMSGSTRIVVIPLKKLIIMVCVIAALIILAAIFIFGGSSSDAAKSTGVNISTSTDTVKRIHLVLHIHQVYTLPQYFLMVLL